MALLSLIRFPKNISVVRTLSMQTRNIQERRERVFLVLAAIFLSAMAVLNVVGITRFVQLGPLAVAVGVLPYPLTFLCTDLVSELYGQSRANYLVWVGLIVNVFVLLVMYLGQALPSVGDGELPPWQQLNFSQPVNLPNGERLEKQGELFYLVYACTRGAVFASMGAYLTAQFIDVSVFHMCKRWTKGQYLWLRNNVSTLTSQAVDSVVVIGITFGAVYYQGQMTLEQLFILMGSNYLFKMVTALLDTIPFYILVYKLRGYLQLEGESEVES